MGVVAARWALGIAGAGLVALSCVGLDGLSGTSGEPEPPEAGADADATTTDAPADVTSEAGEAAAPACDDSMKYAAPLFVAGIDLVDKSDGTPRLTADELTLVFQSNRGPLVDGGLSDDLYIAVRPTLTSAFSPPTPIAELNTDFGDSEPTISPDGLTIVFKSTRSGQAALYTAKRPSPSMPFADIKELSTLGTFSDLGGPSLSADGQELYFHGQEQGFGLDLYKAVALPSIGGFGVATRLSELNSTTSFDVVPGVASDHRSIFWASTRADGIPAGGWDMWTASRATSSGPFTSVHAVTELNGPFHEFAGWISPDLCRLYFTSNRGGGDIFHLYVATRAPKP